MRTRILRTFILIVFLGISGNTAMAQDLVYRPVNPVFGGDALNYSGLLNIATAQNRFTDPNEFDPFDDDPIAEFTQSLQRQILNVISNQLISGQLGEDFLLEGGTTLVGNFQVNISESLEGLSILLTDFGTGGTTQLTVPFF